MQTLTAMTLGALALGGAAFLYDTASADEKMCAGREVSVYFEKGKSEINPFSKAVVDRVAEDVKACGAAAVVVDAGPDGQRAEAISSAFESHGVKPIVATPSGASADGFIPERAATVRLAGDEDEAASRLALRQ